MGVLFTRSLWNEWRFLLKIILGSFLISTVIAIVLPKRYESEARLMTPGGMNSNTAVVGLLQSRTLALVVGLLQSRTLEDHLIERFDLKRVYSDRTSEDARQDLEKHSEITLDDKHGIIAIRVRDGNPDRAVAMVQGYVDELNLLIIRMDANSAHRERVSLGNLVGRAQQDLESAQKEFSAFSSENAIPTMGDEENALIDVPGAGQGELIVE